MGANAPFKPPVKRKSPDETPIKVEPVSSSNEAKRPRYSVREDCHIMDQVLGCAGIFQRGQGETKAMRWKSIATAVTESLAKDDVDRKAITGEALRKHVDDLRKKFVSQYAGERKKSGVDWTPKTDKERLEGQMADYIGRLESEDASRAEDIASKKKAKSATSGAGYTIRKRAMECEPRKATVALEAIMELLKHRA